MNIPTYLVDVVYLVSIVEMLAGHISVHAYLRIDSATTTVLGGNSSVMLDYHWGEDFQHSPTFVYDQLAGGAAERESRAGLFYVNQLKGPNEHASAYKIYTGSLHTFLEKGMYSFAVSYDLKMTF